MKTYIYIRGEIKSKGAKEPRIFDTLEEARAWFRWYQSIPSFKADAKLAKFVTN